jgi:hypothetical protein
MGLTERSCWRFDKLNGKKSDSRKSSSQRQEGSVDTPVFAGAWSSEVGATSDLALVKHLRQSEPLLSLPKRWLVECSSTAWNSYLSSGGWLSAPLLHHTRFQLFNTNPDAAFQSVLMSALLNISFFLLVVRNECRTWCMLGIYSTTEL